ncbi:MAG: hypothetical protein ABSE25_14705 [Syntrophorhabdales bacterium]
MKGVRGDAKRLELDPGLHRIVRTSILIFDSAVTLLGEPPEEGVTMPGPAHIACIRSMLASLGIGEDEPFPPS